MILTIEKNISWEKINYVTLDDERNIVNNKELKFENDVTTIELDLEKEKFIYFTNGEIESEIIILSDGLERLELLYNEKTKSYTCYLSLNNHDDYGTIRTFKIKDRKNLKHRGLFKSKIINVWTPSNYDPEKEYGMILLFDSQNMFDVKKFGEYTTKNDPYGGWQVETIMEKLDNNYILVGIDNSDRHRMTELMCNTKVLKERDGIEKFDPRVLKLFQKAKLDNFGDFIVETLLPTIFDNYKIRKDEVGICGSSAGGMASLYLGLKYSNIFSFILPFTPAIGLYDEKAVCDKFKELLNNDYPQPEIYYFQGAKGDLEKMLYYANLNLLNNLIEAGYDKELIHSYVELTAEHNENPWRYAFNYFIAKKFKNI